MASNTAKEYVLPHDASESRRLNLQHQAFVSSAGYLLHPRILSHASTLVDSPHVADIATGTGAWLLALEQRLNDAPSKWILRGLDISADQFPDSGTDCQFSTLDIRQPIPQHLKGTFDVVHIRMLLGGLTTPDWTVVAQNVFHLLRPGGWIQWHEIAAPSIRAYPSSAASYAETQGSQKLLDTCVTGFQRIGRFMAEDMPMFRNRVSGAGFVDVKVASPSSDREVEMRAQGSLTMWEAVSAALRYLIEADPTFGVTLEEAEHMIQKSRRELGTGLSYWRWDMYIVTAQKPF